MQITDELIKKFLANKCTDVEAKAVIKYLDKHPGLLPVYLRPSWMKADGDASLPPGYPEEMLLNIQVAIGSEKGRLIKRNFRWMAIAAFLLVLISVGWLYNKMSAGADNGEKNKLTAGNKGAGTHWNITRNTTGKIFKIILQDGSVVMLSPGTLIKYTDSFNNNSRDLYLEGDAYFEVAQDAKRPFAVHSGLFVTTVLGTSFRVMEDGSGAGIQLHSGKVMIKAASKGLAGWKDDIYLSPGEQLMYDLIKGATEVSRFREDRSASGAEKLNSGKKEAKLVFDNTPLADVMEQLEKAYHQSIRYNKDELAGMYFSGSVLKDDSLSLILKVVAQMNKLDIIPKADGFLVRKAP